MAIRPKNVPYAYFGGLVIITAALLVTLALLTKHFSLAWAALTKPDAAFDKRPYRWLTIPLAIDGYLFVPIAIGTAAAGLVQRSTFKRLQSSRNVEDLIAEFRDGDEPDTGGGAV